MEQNKHKKVAGHQGDNKIWHGKGSESKRETRYEQEEKASRVCQKCGKGNRGKGLRKYEKEDQETPKGIKRQTVMNKMKYRKEEESNQSLERQEYEEYTNDTHTLCENCASSWGNGHGVPTLEDCQITGTEPQQGEKTETEWIINNEGGLEN